MATMGESVIDMSGEWFGDGGRGRERAAGGWRDGGMGESVIDMGDGERRGEMRTRLMNMTNGRRRGDGASFSPQLDDYLPDVYGRLPVLVDADILAVEVADML